MRKVLLGLASVASFVVACSSSSTTGSGGTSGSSGSSGSSSGSSGSTPSSVDGACTMWRQTNACNGSGGARAPQNDKACDVGITTGDSGYCECEGGNVYTNCGHATLTCNDVCAAGSWSATSSSSSSSGSSGGSCTQVPNGIVCSNGDSSVCKAGLTCGQRCASCGYECLGTQCTSDQDCVSAYGSRNYCNPHCPQNVGNRYCEFD